MAQRSYSQVQPLSTTGFATPWWVKLIVAAGALLMTAGAIIALANPAMLLGKDQQINEATRIFAGYLFSRNLAIAAMLISALAIGARRALTFAMLLTAVVQILDAGVDCIEGRWTIVPGVIILGIVFLVGAIRTSTHPIWSIASWRDSS